MAELRIHEESDAYVFVLLQGQDPNTGTWAAETGASTVDFEVFDPDGVSLGVKGLGSGATYEGVVEEDGQSWGKYRALFHFSDPGIYKSVIRVEGAGGGRVSSNDTIPVEEL